MEGNALKKTLTPLMLWGLGVGYVISGMYFGWNYGLDEGGPLGMAVATLCIIIMYTTFSFSYTELACAIPKAGGVFDYTDRALGKDMGFLAGMAQNIEFIFAPAAIAFAIGAYFNIFLPQFSVEGIAIVAFLIFMGLNIYGVRAAATFELVITIFAVAELLIFAGVTLPHFKFENLTNNPLPHGWAGAFAATPFAIWFFLGIEGVANVAEEAIHPQRDILKGFGSAIFTLVILCVITFIAAVGVGGWEKIVYDNGIKTDKPLPLAMGYAIGNNHPLYHMLVTIGLFGLIASFHGLILAAGRSTFEFGRVGYGPKILGKVNARFHTPANAILFNTIIGIPMLLFFNADYIIRIATFGALTLYIVSMISLFVLRKKEPDMPRPFRVPMYPVFPALALIIALVAMVAMIYFNLKLALIYFGILLGCFVLFKLVHRDENKLEHG